MFNFSSITTSEQGFMIKNDHNERKEPLALDPVLHTAVIHQHL